MKKSAVGMGPLDTLHFPRFHHSTLFAPTAPFAVLHLPGRHNRLYPLRPLVTSGRSPEYDTQNGGSKTNHGVMDRDADKVKVNSVKVNAGRG